jgi:hypothetical protein
LPPQHNPAKTIIDEVGIASQDGAYVIPYAYTIYKEPVDPAIQANWFSAACQVIQQFHIPGIYYWDLPFNETKASLAWATSWVGRPGAQSIKNCFAQLEY